MNGECDNPMFWGVEMKYRRRVPGGTRSSLNYEWTDWAQTPIFLDNGQQIFGFRMQAEAVAYVARVRNHGQKWRVRLKHESELL